MPRVSVLITDLDNTLYDWVEMWGAAFTALLEGVVRRSGIPQAQLEREVRAVHQTYGTSEYSFLIQELPSLQRLHDGEDIATIYRDAIAASGGARRETLKLYPGVESTLTKLRRAGVLIVGYTESRAFYTKRRVQRLGLDGVLDALYSPPDHELPDTIKQIRTHGPEHYQLQVTRYQELPEGELKPNPKVLRDIIHNAGATLEQCIYVGDNLMKDVAMAQVAGVRDVHAAYGEAQHLETYALLRRVSHWPDQTVQEDREVHEQRQVTPSHTLHKSFSELLDIFEFVRWQYPNDGGKAL